MSQTSADSGSSEPRTRAICFVLMPSNEPLPVQNLTQRIRENFGAEMEITSKEDHRGLSFATDQGRVMLTGGGYPIPNGEASLAASGNPFWNQGKEVVDSHQSHIVVVVDCVGDGIDAAILSTRVIRAALAASDAIGVYWGKGKIANSKEFFLKASEDVTRESLPLHLWMRFQLHREDDRLWAYTIGMRQFQHQEIHTTACDWQPKDLAGCIYDAAHFIVSNRVILNDRDTVGRSDADRLEVRFVPNRFRPEETVTQIQMGRS